jgi:hypothetical protein
MANIKITALQSQSSNTLAQEDVFIIDDVSELLTKKLTVSNLMTYTSNAVGNAYAVSSSLQSFAAYSNTSTTAMKSIINLTLMGY